MPRRRGMSREASERLSKLEALLEKYEAAEIEIITGAAQSYTIGSRSLTKLDLSYIRKTIKDLQDEIGAIKRGSSRASRAVVIRDW